MKISYTRSDTGKWFVNAKYNGQSITGEGYNRKSASRSAMWYLMITLCTLGDLPRGHSTDQSWNLTR